MTESIRVAAAGDIHCAEPLRERIARAFADLQGRADIVLLAGDLTTHGEPEEASRARGRLPRARPAGLRRPRQPRLPREPLRRGDRGARGGRHPRAAARLRRARGRRARARASSAPRASSAASPAPSCPTSASRCCARSTPRRRARWRRSRPGWSRSPAATAASSCSTTPRSRRRSSASPSRSGPSSAPRGWPQPIGAHRPDLVLHGHAHRGTFAGELGPVPVRNVAVHVLGKDFELFEL